MEEGILVINPGTTSTKIAVYDGEKEEQKATLRHDSNELHALGSVASQLDFRYQHINKWITETGCNGWVAVVGRGGLLRPCEGGTYQVSENLLDDVRHARWGEHASNLGSMLANKFSSLWNVPAFVVDPVTTDEFKPVSRISGVPGIERKCRSHALNIKATARRAAEELNKPVEETRFVVAHLGGGISIAALHGGRVSDVNDGMLGMGPFSPERAGALPLAGVMDLVREKGYEETKKIFSRESGFVGYFGTSSLEEVEKKIADGDKEAELVLDAMVYQVAKEIGAMTVALDGNIDGIVLTGGMIHSEKLLNAIREKIAFLGRVFEYAGEEEMLALAQGALRVVRGEEKAKIYGESE